jgi:hypothetical protein
LDCLLGKFDIEVGDHYNSTTTHLPVEYSDSMSQTKPNSPKKQRKSPKRPIKKTAAKKTAKGKGGRPSSYTEKLKGQILDEISSSAVGVFEIHRRERMPHVRKFYELLERDEEFRHRYARAKEFQGDYMFELTWTKAASAITVAHGEAGTGEAGARVQAVKLEVDTLKWTAAKLLPKKYGDRVTQELTGPDGGPIKQEAALKITPEIEAQIARIANITKNMKAPNL